MWKVTRRLDALCDNRPGLVPASLSFRSFTRRDVIDLPNPFTGFDPKQIALCMCCSLVADCSQELCFQLTG
jgi:hypothetical protein